MSIKMLSLGPAAVAFGLAANLVVPAGAADVSHADAIKACSTANERQPVSLVTAIDDGRGGSLVWLTDADANLWLCSANAEGQVHAYSLISGDLLAGAGGSLVEPVGIGGEGDVPLPEHNPLAVAEQACQAYLSGESGTVVGRGQDGLGNDWVPGYFVFIETSEGTFLCDATADAQVWAFAEIGEPLVLGNAVG
jgi:hypothetical protein